MTVDEYVRQVVAQAPPLNDEQKTRLAELLRPVRRAYTNPIPEQEPA